MKRLLRIVAKKKDTSGTDGQRKWVFYSGANRFIVKSKLKIMGLDGNSERTTFKRSPSLEFSYHNSFTE